MPSEGHSPRLHDMPEMRRRVQGIPKPVAAHWRAADLQASVLPCLRREIEGREEVTSYECDMCGKTLHHGDMFTAIVKRVGACSGRTYELCKECADEVKAVISATVQAKKAVER